MKSIITALLLATFIYPQNNFDFRSDSLFVVYETEEYHRSDDCNAKCDLTSDGQNIIINVTVKDDSLIFNNSINSDHIEIWFGYPDMFQYGFSGKYGNKYAYIIGNDKYLYQYQEKPYLKSVKEEAKNPYVYGDDGLLSENYYELIKNRWYDWLKTEIDEYLSSVRKDSLSKINVFYGLTHFGINPKNDSVYFYDRENYSYYEKFLNLKIGELNRFVNVESTVEQNGYTAKIIVKPEALGFVNRNGITGINFLIDVVDCDEAGKQSSLLSTSQKRKWAEIDSFNGTGLTKVIEVAINPEFPFLGKKSPDIIDRNIKHLFPDTYMYTTEGWVAVQGITDNFYLWAHPTSYSLPNIQRYYFIQYALNKTDIQVGNKNLVEYNFGKGSYLQLNENTFYNKSDIIGVFQLPDEEVAAIISTNIWGGGRYTRWDESELQLVKENDQKILIGKSDEGSFKLNDTLAIVNYVLDESAMSLQYYPWKDNIELITSENKLILNLDNSSVEVKWDDTGNNLKYKLLNGENISVKK